MKGGTKRLAAYVYSGAVLFLSLSIALYRGGNYENSVQHFRWITNFLSDLGLSTTQSLVRLFFVLGMLSIGLAIFFLVSFYADDFDSPKRRFAKAIAIGSGLALFSVALLPSDLYNYYHRLMLVLGLTILSILWTVLTLSVRTNPATAGRLNVITAIILWLYLIFLFTYPRPETSIAVSMVHAQVQKSVVVIFFVSFLLLLVSEPASKIDYTN